MVEGYYSIQRGCCIIAHYLSTKINCKKQIKKQPYFIQTCLMVKYCNFSRQSRSWSSCHVAVCCVADRIAPKCSTVYIIIDIFTGMQTYCGVKCVVQDGSKLIQHSLQAKNQHLHHYVCVTRSYKEEQKMAKINGSEGTLQ